MTSLLLLKVVKGHLLDFNQHLTLSVFLLNVRFEGNLEYVKKFNNMTSL